MGDYIEKLIALRDAVRAGAGRVADVLDKVGDVVDAARRLALDVEAGMVFSADPGVTTDLNDLEDFFQAPPPVGTAPADAQPPVGAVPPALWPVVAQLVLELIRLARRKG